MPSTNGHHQGSPTTGAHANGSNGPKGAKHEKAAEFAFGTLAVHAGSPHDPATGAVIESVGLVSSIGWELADSTDFALDDILAERAR